MASVRKKPGSKYWYACYTDNSGLQRQVSTKQTGKTAALQIAFNLDRAAHLVRTEAEAIADVQRVYREVRGEAVSTTSVRVFFESWLTNRTGEIAPVSLLRYRSSAKRFLAFLGAAADTPLHLCSEAQVLGFRAERMGQVSYPTAEADVNVLRFAFRKALKKHLIINDPTAELKDLSTSQPRTGNTRRAFTSEEINRLLAAADSEWEGMILFGTYTVQRLGDIANITWGQLDNDTLVMQRRKTGKPAVVPLHPQIVRYLARLTKGLPGDPVFPKAHAKFHVRGNCAPLSNQFFDLMVKVDLIPKRTKTNTGKGHGKTRKKNALSYHCLRHTGNTWLKQAGAGEAVVRDIVGHESTDVSLIYTHIDDGTKLTAITRMPDVGKRTNPTEVTLPNT